jgi:hypothetical protein
MYSLKRTLGRGEKTAQWEPPWFVPLVICNSGNEIIENEMGEANGMYGGETKCIQGFDGET